MDTGENIVRRRERSKGRERSMDDFPTARPIRDKRQDLAFCFFFNCYLAKNKRGLWHKCSTIDFPT